MRWMWVVVLILALIPAQWWAGTIQAVSCSQSEVQQAISSATKGDRVVVPSGSCTWASTVTISGKAITLQGAGIDNTTINFYHTGMGIRLVTSGTSLHRVTGFTFHAVLPGSHTNVSINSVAVIEGTHGWTVAHRFHS